jgi:hypothetical protein
VTGTVDRDDASIPARAFQFYLHDFLCGVLDGELLVLDERVNVVCDNGTDEELAGAGGRDRTGLVVGVRASADNG